MAVTKEDVVSSAGRVAVDGGDETATCGRPGYVGCIWGECKGCWGLIEADVGAVVDGAYLLDIVLDATGRFGT